MSNLNSLRREVKSKEDIKKAKLLQRFFKTGKGDYGEGDIFLGITVPEQRKLAIKYKHLSIDEIKVLLSSKVHEERLIALLILIEQFSKSDDKTKEEIFNFYLNNTKFINNWDLVDLSSHKIIGSYLINKDRKILYKLAKSNNLWEKRIAIISTFAFIKHNEFDDSINIAEILLHDNHDLIHKAVGWVLREIGKKDIKILEDFLSKFYRQMPRTMLRYAIERFPEQKRKQYLSGEV